MTARTAFLILGIAALVAVSYAPQVTALGIGRLGLGMGKLGAADSQGSNGIPPVGCVPGAPTGQMDFSVCSNIGITAALP